jgi:hypothetical protein
MLLTSGLMPPDPANTNPDSIYILASIWDTSNWQRSGNLFGPGFALVDQQFAADGKSLVIEPAPGLVLIGLPDAQILAARQAVVDFQDALAQGDYAKAVAMFQPDQQALDDYKKQGYGSDPLTILQSYCKAPNSRCLPASVLSVARRPDSGYSFLAQFTKPDGSTYKDSTGHSIFEMEAIATSDGAIRVTYLP